MRSAEILRQLYSRFQLCKFGKGMPGAEPDQDEGTSSKPYTRFINPSIAILKRVIDIKKKLK